MKGHLEDSMYGKREHLIKPSRVKKMKDIKMVSLYSACSVVFGGLFYIYITFNHLADAFIQSDVQMRRTIEAIRPSREQQYTSVMTSLS